MAKVLQLTPEMMADFKKWIEETLYPRLNLLSASFHSDLNKIGLPKADITPTLIAQFVGYGLAMQRCCFPDVDKETALSDVEMVYDQIRGQESEVKQFQ